MQEIQKYLIKILLKACRYSFVITLLIVQSYKEIIPTLLFQFVKLKNNKTIGIKKKKN